jgi:hypothetical protein
VPESLHNFEDVFNKESFDTLPEWQNETPGLVQALQAIKLEGKRAKMSPCKYTEVDIPWLHDQWFLTYEDVMQGLPAPTPSDKS